MGVRLYHQTKKSNEKNIIVFVANKILYTNNWKVNKPKLINAQLEYVANNWNGLLTTTGGGMELTKCSHYTLYLRFNNDGTVPTLMSQLERILNSGLLPQPETAHFGVSSFLLLNNVT